MTKERYNEIFNSRLSYLVFTGFLFLFFTSFFVTSKINAQLRAFPGAEGYGRFTTGGRGGTVFFVDRLDDDNNPGSLRYAINQTGSRTIVFRVSGTIYLKSSLSIKNSNLTIAGQTAPGDGICIAGYTPSINCDNVIVRFMRFRLGDVNNVEDDAFNGKKHKDIIIDHCSMTWSVDECASFYDNTNFTMQWCIIGESLFHSVHDKGNHGYGGIQGGWGATFHHNLYVNNSSRNPRFCGARYHQLTSDLEVVDFVNNVIYNWGFNSVYGGELGQQNVRANYYKPGPATQSDKRNRILNPTEDPGTNSTWGKFYVADNFVEGYPNTTADNWTTGVQGPSSTIKAQIKVDQPFPIADVTTQATESVYQTVLDHVGANFPKLDSVDSRLINEASTGVATYEGIYETIRSVPDPNLICGIIDSQTDVGGWPILNSLPAPTDTDDDGIPDVWELANGLNPNDPNDRNETNAGGYTMLEVYLNSLVSNVIFTSVKNNKTTIPADFILFQNYPNPFNPSTTIHYNLPYGGLVDIKIFSIQGQLIRQLYSSENKAGNYYIIWDGKNQNRNLASSGIYLCAVRFSDQLKTMKMLLIK